MKKGRPLRTKYLSFGLESAYLSASPFTQSVVAVQTSTAKSQLHIPTGACILAWWRPSLEPSRSSGRATARRARRASIRWMKLCNCQHARSLMS